MRVNEALHFFNGVTKTADAAGVTRAAVYQWKKSDLGMVPEASAYRLQLASKGALKVDSALYQKLKLMQDRSRTANRRPRRAA